MRPILLDLFCGAGGAARGYHDAGFEVIGVDIRPQRTYPYEFHRGDALEVGATLLSSRTFHAIHGSPPCQRYTGGAKQAGTVDRHADLIAPTRALMRATGLPYVIENVEEAAADLINPVILCGTTFGLGVFRHRAFEALWWATLAEPCHHAGRIGDGRYVTVTGKPGGRSRRDGIQHGRLADWSRAMGIDWMTARQMAQAIPPAYTAHIGAQLLAALAVTP